MEIMKILFKIKLGKSMIEMDQNELKEFQQLQKTKTEVVKKR